MKRFLHSLSARQIILSISGAASFLLFLILVAVISNFSSKQQSQQMADRWSEKKDISQVSCFFSPNAEVSVDTIETFRHTIDKALQEASITQESVNPGARLWADTFSADGKITLESDKASLEADAIGIGGDFFQFHPLNLLNGSYFSGNDLMQDYVVVDEDAAWQLFGSNDVAGMTLYIKGVPHMVTGVVKRDEGKLSEAAGLDSSLVYVSYDTLLNLGSSNGINHYEIVMPNPVSKFAYNYIEKNIGVEEKEMQVVENTTRYGFLERLKVLASFGTRSMNGKAIIYPYWENVARGYEDILGALTLAAFVFLMYPVIIIVIWVIILWRHKTWTARSVYHLVQDKAERRMEKLREKRKTGKGQKKGPKRKQKHAGGERSGWMDEDILDLEDGD